MVRTSLERNTTHSKTFCGAFLSGDICDGAIKCNCICPSQKVACTIAQKPSIFQLPKKETVLNSCVKCVGSPQSWYMWLSEWREKTKYVTHVDGYRLRCSWWYKGLRLVHLSLKGVCVDVECVSLVSNVHQKSFNTTPSSRKNSKIVAFFISISSTMCTKTAKNSYVACFFFNDKIPWRQLSICIFPSIELSSEVPSFVVSNRKYHLFPLPCSDNHGKCEHSRVANASFHTSDDAEIHAWIWLRCRKHESTITYEWNGRNCKNVCKEKLLWCDETSKIDSIQHQRIHWNQHQFTLPQWIGSIRIISSSIPFTNRT